MFRSSLLAAACVLAAVPADAQIFHREPVHTAGRGIWYIDVGPRYAQPIGDFRANVASAWGGGIGISHHFSWFTPLGLRGDFSVLNYGMERQRVPLSTTINRVFVDMRTSNNIVVVGGGPELMVPRGPVRPYVFGFVGYSYYYTQSSVGDDDGGSFASSTNFDDGGFASGFGGGLRIPFAIRRTTVAVDAGARLTRSGTRTYLRRGDVIDQPDGSLQFNTRTTTADFWQYHLGVSFSPSRSGRR